MNENKDCLLLIFVRNPELGKVKTRLATTLGDEAALAVYFELLAYTRKITENLPIRKRVYYSEKPKEQDLWTEVGYERQEQVKGNLGERMFAAFADAFAEGFQRVVIIGSDCYELRQENLEQAFEALQKKPVVLGPAEDGGYYLLGMRELQPAFFQDIPWSTSEVKQLTLQKAQELNLEVTLLPMLRDIDTEADLPEELMRVAGKKV